MIQRVIFRQAAVEDVVEAAAWYEAHATGLGEQLIDEILNATRRAQDNRNYFALFIAMDKFAARSQTASPTEFSSRSLTTRSTSRRFSTKRAMIVDGQSDCEGVSIPCLSTLNSQPSTILHPPSPASSIKMTDPRRTL